jgi:hypothetical protein
VPGVPRPAGKAHGTSADALPVWTDLAHTLVNVKEFIYLH